MVMPNQAVETQAAMGAGTEGGRRPTVVPAPIAANPEISDRPRRRTFTAAEKLRILKEADQAAGSGATGALLRRHGLYSSALGEWRRQREGGNPGRPDTGEAWAEIAPGQSAGHRTGLCAKGKRPAPAPSGAGRGNHRRPKKLADLLGSVGGDRSRVRSLKHALTEGLASAMPVKGTVSATCAALGLSRASLQRSTKRQSRPPTAPLSRPSPARALPAGSRQTVLDLLRSPRFADLAPAEIYATLLDEGVYHCSVSTMYRLLAANNEVLVRRKQLRHPIYTKPELLAVCPSEVWSWDITKLKGPAKWTYFYLYVIIDIFSRRVVGWCVADASANLFKALFDDTIAKHQVPPGQLTLHADRGSPMKAKATAFLLADLGVTKSHSWPHTSNDNPFSESHFKTLKYQPTFPSCFGCMEDAKIGSVANLRLRQPRCMIGDKWYGRAAGDD